MPKKTSHRGPAPEDERLFGPESLPTLRQATSDLCWLLDHGYAVRSAVELVGNRYALVQRQRLAIARCACSADAVQRVRSRQVSLPQLRDQELWLDGYNVLTAIEAALGGALVLLGRDGCCRDMAGIHRRYRRVSETLPALQLLGELMAEWGVRHCCWWLDSPISNSGRLKRAILEAAASAGWSWQAELVANPDRVLAKCDHIVATADRVILARCQRWFNLERCVISSRVNDAWLVDLSPNEPRSD